MGPPQFLTDFAQAIQKADRIQPALLVISIITAVGFALSGSAPARALALLGAAGFVVALIASVTVLVPLQRRIIASSPEEVDAIEAMRRAS